MFVVAPPNGVGREGGRVLEGNRETAADESGKEMADRVGRHQADYCSGYNVSLLLLQQQRFYLKLLRLLLA